MSRLTIAHLALILVAIVGTVGVGFLVILRRERRRRAHWSTRTRAAHPHWSLTAARRIEVFVDRLTPRRRSRHHRRRRDL